MTEDLGPELERSRIDRRAAMKAALAGVAAAAVWQAPRIEGLSVAPDVAQAASCTGGTVSTPTFIAAEVGVGIGEQRFCWGGILSGTTCDNDNTQSATIAGNNFGITVIPSGYVENAVLGGTINNGSLGITVNGIDPPYQSCVVSFNSAANATDCVGSLGSTFFNPDPFSFVLNFANSGTQNLPIACNVDLLAFITGARVTLTLTCTCL